MRGEPKRRTGRTVTPGTGRPSRSTTRPTIGTSSLTSLSVRSLASSVVVNEAQAGPNPRARATTIGWLPLSWTWTSLQSVPRRSRTGTVRRHH